MLKPCPDSVDWVTSSQVLARLDDIELHLAILDLARLKSATIEMEM